MPSCISCYLGVTEPALFGVNMKYGFPLICGMIGSAIAAMISVGCSVQALSIGVGGLPGILSIVPQYYGYFLLAMAVAIVVPFVLTLLVGMKKLTREERGLAAADTGAGNAAADSTMAVEESADQTAADAAEGELKAFLGGRVIPLEEVPDDVFSQHVMGDGLAIEPTDNVVKAPANGTVSAVMEDSRHACGLAFANGMEVLIHVGIDTVDMNGDGFELFVKEGDKVRAGDPLIRFDFNKIKAAGHPVTTVFVVTEEGNAKNIEYRTGMDCEAGRTTIVTFE